MKQLRVRGTRNARANRQTPARDHFPHSSWSLGARNNGVAAEGRAIPPREFWERLGL